MVNNLITVWLLWFIVIVSMWLIRMVLCKGSKDLEGEKSKAKVKLIKASVTFASLIVSILAIIISLIFILFIGENNHKGETIHQAALPKGFKESTKIVKKSSLDKKIEDVEKAATEANDKAVKESVKFFKSKK